MFVQRFILQKQAERAANNSQEEIAHLKRLHATELTSTKDKLESHKRDIAEVREKLAQKEEVRNRPVDLLLSAFKFFGCFFFIYVQHTNVFHQSLF